MRIDVEEVRKLHARMKEINSVPLEEIEWFENGKKIDVDSEIISDWKFMGLTNFYFAVDLDMSAVAAPVSVSEQPEGGE